MLRQRRRLVQCLNVAGGLLLNKTFPIGEGRSPHRETFKNSRTLCGALPEGEALFATGLQSTAQWQPVATPVAVQCCDVPPAADEIQGPRRGEHFTIKQWNRPLSQTIMLRTHTLVTVSALALAFLFACRSVPCPTCVTLRRWETVLSQ